MSDDLNNKVVNLFRKSSNKEDSIPQRFFKGFQYVKITKDDNGNYFKEDSLREYAQGCFYIVTVMKHNSIGVALYKYKVPYSSMLEFFNMFRNNSLYGEIIDIERYIPEDLA
jgi:hypothetical protein